MKFLKLTSTGDGALVFVNPDLIFSIENMPEGTWVQGPSVADDTNIGLFVAEKAEDIAALIG